MVPVKWPRFIIALLLIFIYGSSLYMVFVLQIQLDEPREKLAFMLIGALTTYIASIIGTYFGDTEGRQDSSA